MTDGKGNYTQINRSNVTLEEDQSAPLKFRQVSFLQRTLLNHLIIQNLDSLPESLSESIVESQSPSISSLAKVVPSRVPPL